MAVQFADIKASLMLMFVFHDSIASNDTHPLFALQRDETIDINDQFEVNCTELKVYLKVLIKEQKFLLNKFDHWMNKYNHHGYGFQLIEDAEERICLSGSIV